MRPLLRLEYKQKSCLILVGYLLRVTLFSGSLDAMGALPSYDHLKTVIASISTKQAAPLMIDEPMKW